MKNYIYERTAIMAKSRIFMNASLVRPFVRQMTSRGDIFLPLHVASALFLPIRFSDSQKLSRNYYVYCVSFSLLERRRKREKGRVYTVLVYHYVCMTLHSGAIFHDTFNVERFVIDERWQIVSKMKPLAVSLSELPEFLAAQHISRFTQF